MKPTLQIHNGQPMTTSVNIAQYFDREHRIVTRAIRNILPHVSEGFRVRNFVHPVRLTIAGQSVDGYLLTRSGFAMIALGFTGEKAIQFREAYITRFDEMEGQLRRRQYKENLLGSPRISDAVKAVLGEARAEMSLSFAMTLMISRGLYLPPITRDQMIKLIQTGEIEGHKRDRVWHVYQDSFAAWLERRKAI